ncbi:MAG: hypothetical protein U0T83_06365 [Bacteriovoracaceae bacterium]
MKFILIFNNRLKNFISILILQLIWLSLFRLSFFLYFKENNSSKDLSILLKVFYLGFKFDLRLSLVMLAPPFSNFTYQSL